MIFPKRIFLSVIIIFIIATVEISEASVSMRLEQYVSEILLNNQSLQAGLKSVEADYYSVLSSVGYQRPSIAASLGGGWVSAQSVGNDKNYNVTTGNLAMTFTQRIDISGSYNLNEKQYILGYEVSRANFDNNLNSLIATAEETWWSAVLARENMKLQNEILTQRSENHRVTVEKYNQELVPKLDVVRSEAQVVEAETLAKTAETNYKNLLANLSYLAGGLDVEPLEEELKVPVFDVELDFDEALNYRPDVRAAKLNLERAKLVKKLNAKGLSPTLDFGFQWTVWSDPETVTTPQNGEAGASLTLSVPIYDGKQTKFKVLNSDRLVQVSEANLLSLQEQTRRDITVAMNNWRNAAASEKDKQRQVERSEEELRITELMYSEGMGAQIDLINAQTAYQAVKTEYLDSVKNMYVALVELRKAIGDYSPDEDGTWQEALKRYGKGNNVVGEAGLKTLRMENEKNSASKKAENVKTDEEVIDELESLSRSKYSDEEIEARFKEMTSSM